MIKLTLIRRFSEPQTFNDLWVHPGHIQAISRYKNGSSVLVGRYWQEVTETPEYIMREMNPPNGVQ